MTRTTKTVWTSSDNRELLSTSANGEFYVPVVIATVERLWELREAIDDALLTISANSLACASVQEVL